MPHRDHTALLIVFGTTEGHTREICEFAAKSLCDAGHAATLQAFSATRPLSGRTDRPVLIDVNVAAFSRRMVELPQETRSCASILFAPAPPSARSSP